MSIVWVGLAAVFAVLAVGAAYTQWQAQQIEAEHPAIGRLISTSEGRLHVWEAGATDAPPHRTVVLLHGASGSLLDMKLALGDRLAGKYRIIAIDRPGLGWSERNSGSDGASPAVQAKAIAGALSAVGVSGALVVGHSWAGTVALQLALNHPETTSGLLLLSPVSHPWPGGVTWYYYPSTWPVLGEIFIRAIVTPVASVVLEHAVKGVFQPQTAPADYARRSGARLILRPASFRANAEDVRNLKPFVTAQWPRYASLRLPVEIVSGDADDVVWTKIHSVSLEREISGAKLTVLPGMGHMPHHAANEVVIERLSALSERAARRNRPISTAE